MRKWSAADICIRTKMYDGITDASRIDVSPSMMGTHTRSILSSRLRALIIMFIVRSTERSKPLAVCSMYHSISSFFFTCMSWIGRPSAFFRCISCTRSTRTDLVPVWRTPSCLS